MKLTIAIISYRWQIATKASSNSIYRRTTGSVGGLFWNREIPGHSDTRGSCGRTQHRRGQNSGKMVDWQSEINHLSSFTARKTRRKLIDSAWIWSCFVGKILSLRIIWIDARPHTASRSFIISWCVFRNSIYVHIFWRVAFRWKAFFYHRVVYPASLERGAVLISKWQWSKFLLERLLVECRKVIGFAFITLDDWLKNARHFFIQSEVKQKSKLTATQAFSRALLVHVIVCVLCDWLEWLLWFWFYDIQLKTTLLTSIKRLSR